GNSEEGGGEVAEEAARQFGVSRDLVYDALKVKQHGVDGLIDAVRTGDVKVSAAAKVAALPAAEQAKVLAGGSAAVKNVAKQQRTKTRKEASRPPAPQPSNDADDAAESDAEPTPPSGNNDGAQPALMVQLGDDADA